MIDGSRLSLSKPLSSARLGRGFYSELIIQGTDPQHDKLGILDIEHVPDIYASINSHAIAVRYLCQGAIHNL